MKKRVVVQSKHVLSEELLENIWRRSSAPDECFADWRRKSQTDLGVFSSDNTFFWANWVCSSQGLISVFDPSVFGEPKEWRTINIIDDNEEESSRAVESRLNNLAARLEEFKQRRGER